MIFLFNPENDLALANAGANYVIHRHARQLRHDLALLPAWLAQDGDALLVVDGQDTESLQAFLTERHISVEIITPERLRRERLSDTFCPWGWNSDLRRRLVKSGVDPKRLPAEQQLERWRMQAHRRLTVEIHHALATSLAPEELTDINQVDDFIARHPEGCYLKAPWSGSGSGVWHLPAGVEAGRDLRQWARGVLRRQHSLLAERALDRVADVAVELQRENCQIRVVGYSVFNNDSHNQYRYGIVATSERLHAIICERYPAFDDNVARLIYALSSTLDSDYNGFLGVDMALYRDADGDIAIDPCIEVNLRMTMGLVTAVIGNRLPDALTPKAFSIIPIEEVTENDILLNPILQTTRHVAVLRDFSYKIS